MKAIIICIYLAGLSLALSAQTVENALRFSKTSYNSSARSAAMGGAFGALGGDISSVNINPGGVGVFRKLEASYTSLLDFSQIQCFSLPTPTSGFNYSNSTTRTTNYLVGNVGAVLGIHINDGDGFQTFAIGFTYTNTANFNRRIDQAVNNSASSLTDVYAAQSQGIAPVNLDIFNTALFYDSYLTYQSEDGNYHSILETNGETPEVVNQYKTGREKGYMGELAIPLGTNFRDKLYLGMVFGIPAISYKINSTYSELAEENAPSQLDYYNLQEYRKIMGTGFNIKFGVIYRPIPEIRFGAAIHSPSWLGMEQKMENTVYSLFTTKTDPSVAREYQDYYFSSAEYDGFNEPHTLRYQMQTPWRSVLSFGAVLGKIVILSMDYEYVDYTSIKYKRPLKMTYVEYEDDEYLYDRVRNLSANMDYKPVNRAIKASYRPTHNFRAGIELRATNFLSLRGGYGHQDSPYKNDRKYGKIETISGGFGLNFGILFFDFAYTQNRKDDQSQFYNYNGITATPILNKHQNKEFRLTFGVKIPTDI